MIIYASAVCLMVVLFLISYFMSPMEIKTIIFDCSDNDKVPLLNWNHCNTGRW